MATWRSVVLRTALNADPLQFLLLTFAGRVNRNQQEAIEYLREENRIPSYPKSRTT